MYHDEGEGGKSISESRTVNDNIQKGRRMQLDMMDENEAWVGVCERRDVVQSNQEGG